MSFKNKMHKRGISKLDSLVETPDYITPKKPAKTSLNWLKFAVPIAAGLVVLAIPITMAASGILGGKSSKKSSSPDSSHYSDPDFNYDDNPASIPSDAEEHGSTPSGEPNPDSTPINYKNDSFGNLLTNSNVKENISIDVYNYGTGGYVNLVSTITGEDVTKIINSLNTINSDYVSYTNAVSSTSANRNENNRLLGINHKIVFKDGDNKLTTYYYSQFTTLTTYESAFNISGSEAFTILDTYVEMDYDPAYDETIIL